MTKKVICPACGQSDQVEKVSTLYVTGIGMRRRPQDWKAAPEDSATGGSRGLIASSESLSRKLTPPSSGKKAPTRPLHPDLVVTTFSLIVPIFLYGIFATQGVAILPMLALVAILYGLYFWKRKSIIAKFERQQKEQQEKDARVQRSISRWMKLYYCGRDDGVFEPGKGELVPVDFMLGYLLGE